MHTANGIVKLHHVHVGASGPPVLGAYPGFGARNLAF